MAESKLTAKGADTKKPGAYKDGGGLTLFVSDGGAGKWVYRFKWLGKPKNMGLGPRTTVSLAEARLLRDQARKVLASGRNPIEARQEAERVIPTFGVFADEVYEAKRPEWRNEKHSDQWDWTLKVACADLRPKAVDAIDVTDVLAILKPLWVDKPETGSRVRQRLEAVLNAAKARGFRTGENPAAWRGHLEHLLPKRPKLTRGHHPSMPYQDLPAFIERLRDEDYIAAKALEFTILTAARSGEVFGARWSEIDMAGGVWIIPAPRMKAGREHRVPLSSRALEILKPLAAGMTGAVIFPSPRGDKPLSHIAMQKVLERMGVDNATVHGFRSSFRDWCGHETAFPREIAEQALAHRLGDSAELAYKRGDFLEKRRELMEAWSRYCEPQSVDNVLKFKKA